VKKASPARPSPAAKARSRNDTSRREAINLLNEVTGSLNSIPDLFYRARIQTGVAEAYWKIDQARSRELFKRSWQLARASDETDRRENAVAGLAQGGAEVTEARDEVLARVAALDPSLASTLLKDLIATEGETSNQSAKNRANSPWHDPSPVASRMLELANELLAEGHYTEAAAIAQRAASEGISGDLAGFICQLGSYNPSAAAAVYQRALAATRRNRAADVNSVLLLAAPIVSPSVIVVVDAQGSLLFRSVPVKVGSASAFGPEISGPFFDTGASILLRPISASDNSQAGRLVASYVAISRLLPYFQADAPQFAPALAAQRDRLAANIEGQRVSSLDAQAQTTRVALPGNDPLRGQTDELAHAGDTASRDLIAEGIVRSAVRHRFWDRAKRTAAQISDPGLQRSAMTFIAVSEIADISRAYVEDKEHDFEAIVNFLNSANAPPFATAWGYAQAAIVAAPKAGQQRAASLIGDAARIAGEIPVGTRERLAAYIATASAASEVARDDAWRLTREVVRAANAVQDLYGDEEILPLDADNQSQPENFSIDASPFRLDDFFAKMARLDVNEATIEARALDKPIPRLLSLTAIARSRIETGR
jgi:hypothetical protein